jgi:hypothetical protein
MRHCTICADAELMALSGEVLEQIAARLHRQPDSLLRHFSEDRHSNPYLLGLLTRQRLADIRPSTYR